MFWLLASIAFALEVHDFDAPRLFSAFAYSKMDKEGYAVIADDVLSDPEMLSQTLKETEKFYSKPSDEFSYALGNVKGRTAVAPGIHKIGGAPKQVLVLGHSEASYLTLSPRFLMFSCPVPAEIGGETPIFNIQRMEEDITSTPVGKKMFEDVREHGITYIRNDVSKHGDLAEAWGNVGYPTWQDRFPNRTQEEILATLHEAGMVAYFNENDTLHSEWHFDGFRPHPDTGELVWMNQLYGMNGRYWRQHGDPTIMGLPLDARPLNSRVGTLNSNRPLTEAEFTLIDDAHSRAQETFQWVPGRVLFVDNFVYQHGRLPYGGERKRECLVGWGPSVHYNYQPPVVEPPTTPPAPKAAALKKLGVAHPAVEPHLQQQQQQGASASKKLVGEEFFVTKQRMFSIGSAY